MNWRSKTALHIIFWLVVEAATYRYLIQHTDVAYSDVFDSLATVLSHILTFYTFYFIFTRFLKRGLLVTIGLYALAYGLIYFIRFYLLFYVFDLFDQPKILSYTIAKWCSFYDSFMFGMYATFIGLIESKVKSARLEKDLYEQNLKSEMALLRSQLNPHFLYNVLNNIYSLAYPKSTKAAEAVMKLSEIMRYSLSEANQKFVPLKNEVEYLQSYLSLEKMRYRESSLVALKVEGNVTGKEVAPMIFVPFVENAFKHGLQNEMIAIELKIEENVLKFDVHNKYNKESKVSDGSGIGLKNVRRRLELIYPKKHELTIHADKEDSVFKVSLKIYLAP